MIFDDEALSFRIMGVIKVDHEKGYFEVAGRPYAALSYRVSGVGFFESEGERICSCAGDLLYVPAGSAYNVEYSGGEMIVVHFFDCSYNVLENITVLDKQRLKEKMGHLDESTMNHVNSAIQVSFGLGADEGV